MRAQVNCLGGCTDTQYCSQRCAKADWAAHHALLCSGPAAQPPARAVPQSMEDAEEVTRYLRHVLKRPAFACQHLGSSWGTLVFLNPGEEARL